MRLVLIVLLVLLLIGALPNWGFHNFGVWPSGLLGLIVLILIIMAVAGGTRGGPPV